MSPLSPCCARSRGNRVVAPRSRAARPSLLNVLGLDVSAGGALETREPAERPRLGRWISLAFPLQLRMVLGSIPSESLLCGREAMSVACRFPEHREALLPLGACPQKLRLEKDLKPANGSRSGVVVRQSLKRTLELCHGSPSLVWITDFIAGNETILKRVRAPDPRTSPEEFPSDAAAKAEFQPARGTDHCKGLPRPASPPAAA
jgi:hypothetical protein